MACPEAIIFFHCFSNHLSCFTGMTAGGGMVPVTLRNPGRSIPLGNLGNYPCGMLIVFFNCMKLAVSARKPHGIGLIHPD